MDRIHWWQLILKEVRRVVVFTLSHRKLQILKAFKEPKIKINDILEKCRFASHYIQ